MSKCDGCLEAKQGEENYSYIQDVLKKRGKGKFCIYKYHYDTDNLDPDSYSTQLYKDLAKVYSGEVNNHILSFSQKNCELIFKVDENEPEKRLSQFGSDFINPLSKNMQDECKFSDEKIAVWFFQARVLGGHMIFPRHCRSINQAKGGSGIFDRFDLCLDEIKFYYKNHFKVKDKDARHNNGLGKAIKSDEKFFKIFGDEEEGYKKYVDFFMLKDFVNENYEVISLSLSDLLENKVVLVDKEYVDVKKELNGTYLPAKQGDESKKNERTKRYVNNVIALIHKRNKRLFSKLKAINKALREAGLSDEEIDILKDISNLDCKLNEQKQEYSVSFKAFGKIHEYKVDSYNFEIKQ